LTAWHFYQKTVSSTNQKEQVTAIIPLAHSQLEIQGPLISRNSTAVGRGRTVENPLHQMPVTNSFRPKRQKELVKKLKENKPGQEAQLLIDVKSHVSNRLKYMVIFTNHKQLELHGSAVYRQSPDGATDVNLTAKKSIVFLITGQFKVGEKDDYEKGQAHVVEDEETIQLEQGAAAVIIDQA
jgi:hypothetical protein